MKDSTTKIKDNTIFSNFYGKNFKAVSLRLSHKPKGFKQWFWALYGLDIFIQGFPICKLIILANIIYWCIK